MKKIFLKKEKKGFTLLFAVIVSTLVLAVGGSIINIALKQLVLSGTGRESQYAFYAANTGIECALYWDIAGVNGEPAFATSTAFSIPSSAGCADTPNIYDDQSTDPEVRDFSVEDLGDGLTESYFRLQNFKNVTGDDLEYCADVYVRKQTDPSGRVTSTVIESRGYNTCNSNSPRRIERGLEMNY